MLCTDRGTADRSQTQWACGENRTRTAEEEIWPTSSSCTRRPPGYDDSVPEFPRREKASYPPRAQQLTPWAAVASRRGCFMVELCENSMGQLMAPGLLLAPQEDHRANRRIKEAWGLFRKIGGASLPTLLIRPLASPERREIRMRCISD